ncbi:MAG: STM4012 family radical SAM protein [Xanthomonadales bacterium]|nr:STM4012 family radical SAM protein [Xanthomonadales bacterium]
MTQSTDALREHLRQGFAAYTYAYPHKSAYGPFAEPMPLARLWQAEDRQDLFLYVHIPFCHYRCGFCNLFTLGAPGHTLVDAFLVALKRQIRATAAAIGPHRITRMAFGGGTPSLLSVAQFETVMSALHRHFNLQAPHRSFAIEVAPDSASDQRLRSYQDAGVTRVSMGVQSVIGAELDALARPRLQAEALKAMSCIRELDFPIVNLDLIYGIEGQTESSFLASLDAIVAQAPDELYLYPLYVRQLTGLAKANRTRGLRNRTQLYHAGVARLRERGFVQSSMRLFRRTEGMLEDAFACQTIGTVGLGVGARSYTREVHYSEEYAVSRSASKAIIQAYNERMDADFASARFGFLLNLAERRRRFLLQSLLMWPGVDLAEYRAQFASDLGDDFPELASLVELGLAEDNGHCFALTEAGMASADAIGPWLYSADVRQRMGSYDWR